MSTPESLKSRNNLLNIILNNLGNLEEPQKIVLKKIWNVLTYKWQLQILLNVPFLIWFLLDKYINKVHEFDLTVLNYLNLPDWMLSFMGFGQ